MAGRGPVACDRRTLLKYIAEAQRLIDAGGLCGSGTCGALKPGGPPPIVNTKRFPGTRLAS
ncbi:hypothetical protein ACFY36_11675 [Actinoplanes sp. NPDC000266]